MFTRNTPRLIAICSLIAVACAAWYFNAQKTAGVVNNARGLRPAPHLELKDDSGKIVKLGDFAGNAVIVHFWASWCWPCVTEMPELVEFVQSYQGKPLRMIAVSVDDGWDNAHKLLPKGTLPSNLISLLDPTGKMPEAWGTFQLPESYLLDSNLQIVTKLVGGQEWNKEAMRKLMDAMIAKVPHR